MELVPCSMEMRMGKTIDLRATRFIELGGGQSNSSTGAIVSSGAHPAIVAGATGILPNKPIHDFCVVYRVE